ncbi:MAG: hypothetical protein AABY07_00830 [Nanoarchaeota archaeon]
MATKNREKAKQQKRARKEHEANNPGGKSRYARKKTFCNAMGVSASNVPEPKPWK